MSLSRTTILLVAERRSTRADPLFGDQKIGLNTRGDDLGGIAISECATALARGCRF